MSTQLIFICFLSAFKSPCEDCLHKLIFSFSLTMIMNSLLEIALCVLETAQLWAHSEKSLTLRFMKEWMSENWTKDYNVVNMGTVDIWLWSTIPAIKKKMLLTVPPTSWSEWQDMLLKKLIGIRIILVHSLYNASVCQSPCHIYKHPSSPNVQNLSENQMEQKHNSQATL